MFKKAVKQQLKARVALVGPSGSGKTYTALSVASHLGDNVAVIDTEYGSASRYADLFEFDVCELSDHHPGQYTKTIKAASSAGYDVIVIDSLSHAWLAALDLVGGNFNNWKKVRPLERALLDSMLSSPAHIIVTMRAKQEYVMEEYQQGGRTKQKPVRKGLAAIQSSGIEYEFDVCGEMDLDNTLTVSKSRCSALSGEVINKPGEDFALTLKTWLNSGEAVRPEEKTSIRAVPDPEPSESDTGTRDSLMQSTQELAGKVGISKVQKWMQVKFNTQARKDLTIDQLSELKQYLEVELSKAA